MKTLSLVLLFLAIVVISGVLVVDLKNAGQGSAYKAVVPSETTTNTPSETQQTALPIEPTKTSYIFAGKRIAEIDGSKLKYFHDDNLGSHSIITYASGSVMSEFKSYPFGETLVDSSNDYQYTGKENDANTGLYYYGARYYSPGIGRFTQVDPILRTDSNYAYVRNNPMILVDPKGMQSEEYVSPMAYARELRVGVAEQAYNHYVKGALQGLKAFALAATDPYGIYGHQQQFTQNLIEGIKGIPGMYSGFVKANDWNLESYQPNPRAEAAQFTQALATTIDLGFVVSGGFKLGSMGVKALANSRATIPSAGHLFSKVDDFGPYISDVGDTKMMRWIANTKTRQIYMVPKGSDHIYELANILKRDVRELIENPGLIPDEWHGGGIILENNKVTNVCSGLSGVDYARTITDATVWDLNSMIIGNYDFLNEAGLMVNHPQYFLVNMAK